MVGKVIRTATILLLPVMALAALATVGSALQRQPDGDHSEADRQQRLDQEYITQVEDPSGPASEKVLHAEPLYIDLIRDLGARKGELEVNLGYGLLDKREFVKHEYLAEIEWAPVNRLGVEFEIPVTSSSAFQPGSPDRPAADGIVSYKAAIQYTFFVSEPWATSAAVGTIYQSFTPAAGTRSEPAPGSATNPFLVLAHRWGLNWHTLIYTGPVFYRAPEWSSTWENNFSIHYMLPGTRHFIGLETNTLYYTGRRFTIFRPQMRLQLTPHVLTGIVVGVPESLRREGLSLFVRMIYELS